MNELNNTEQALGNTAEELHDEALTMKDVLEEMEGMDLAQLVEESFEGVKQGELVRGTVLQITKEFVIVDIGYKSEGQIPIREFLDEQGNLTVQEGDNEEVLLEKLETEDGGIVLSKEKAAQIKVWDAVRESLRQKPARDREDRIQGSRRLSRWTSASNAFLPGSQVDLRPVRDMDSVVGKSYEFRVLKYNKRRRNVVISRRTLLEEQRASKRVETLKKLETTDVLPGVVKNITDYGVFIDLGGLDGLLHVTDMSWGKSKTSIGCRESGRQLFFFRLLSRGQLVKILDFDPEKDARVPGTQATVPDPWRASRNGFRWGQNCAARW